MNSDKKLLKVFFCGYLLFAICYLLTGCVSIPLKETIPAYNINGTTYLPLIPLCELRNIDWEYDTFTRAVVLTKGAHKINLAAGAAEVLVDGSPRRLKHPVDIYQGTVVVPYAFKEQILDILFKESYPSRRTAAPLAKIKKIAIDAGHGGKDPGAVGRTGLREKDFTLDVAKRLANLLRAEGIEVVMTRSTDTFIPLSRRVDVANRSKVDLFLSIHANANRVRSLSGFEVYYASGALDDSQRALSAAKEAVLDLDSSCFASNSLNLKAILWDMLYTNYRAESIKLAQTICRTINQDLATRILGIKGARFLVLRGTRMPAVLIETGFLSNYNEERRLKNSYYRQKITESIVQGIKNYDQELSLLEVAKQ